LRLDPSRRGVPAGKRSQVVSIQGHWLRGGLQGAVPECNRRAPARGAGASGALHPCLRGAAERRRGPHSVGELHRSRFHGRLSSRSRTSLATPSPRETGPLRKELPCQAVPALVQAPLPQAVRVRETGSRADRLPGAAGELPAAAARHRQRRKLRVAGHVVQGIARFFRNLPVHASQRNRLRGPVRRRDRRFAVAAVHHRVDLPAADSRPCLRRPPGCPRAARNPSLPGLPPGAHVPPLPAPGKFPVRAAVCLPALADMPAYPRSADHVRVLQPTASGGLLLDSTFSPAARRPCATSPASSSTRPTTRRRFVARPRS